VTSTVYTSDRVQVIHGDALDVLPTFETESFELVITDPPYGVEWQSNRRAETFDQLHNDGADDRAGIHDILAECVRLTAQNRHLYVFGPVDVVTGLKVSAPAAMVWDKTVMSGGDITSAWGKQHEPLTFAVGKHRHAGDAGKESVPTRMRKGDVLRFPRPTGRKVRHPSEKPVPLLRELIESSSRQGDRILDPFGGSGSTAVAAILAGRTCVLVDSRREWCDLAASRCIAAEKLADDARWV
jgi:DNA modification methylase